MRKMKFLSLVLVGCLIAVFGVACGAAAGWTRNDTATVGMDEKSAVRLANDETPGENAPVTGSIFLLKTDIADEFIFHSVELKLFGDGYKENTKTGGLTVENGSGRLFSRGNITARFAVYSSGGEKQNYFTLRFELAYTDEDDKENTTYNLDEVEDSQMKVTLKENLTFKFSYTDNADTTQQFEYTIVASEIGRA